jgi:hypothetical protein
MGPTVSLKPPYDMRIFSWACGVGGNEKFKSKKINAVKVQDLRYGFIYHLETASVIETGDNAKLLLA